MWANRANFGVRAKYEVVPGTYRYRVWCVGAGAVQKLLHHVQSSDHHSQSRLTAISKSSSSMIMPEEKKHVWSDLPRRLITIGIGVPIFWWVLQYSWSALTLFMGVHALAAYEYSQLFRHEQYHNTEERILQPIFSWWVFPLLSLTMATVRDDSMFHLVLVAFSAFLFLRAETSIHGIHNRKSSDHQKESKRDEDNSHQRLATTTSALYFHYLQGFVHITIPFHAWYELCRQDELHCHYHTVSLLLIVWNCDNGALICGRILGGRQRHKQPLWLTSISPAKSIEGLCGGCVGGILTTIGLPSFWAIIHPNFYRQEHNFYWNNSTLVKRLFVGSFLSLLAVLGDLWESRLKRSFQTKDSGSLLPGHGGVLDRFDSSFLAVLAYRYFALRS
jgi:CDP-diglyceride synthetase